MEGKNCWGGWGMCRIWKPSHTLALNTLFFQPTSQVGSHYKTPRFPIWVVGSSSHFTVLFSLDKGALYNIYDEYVCSRPSLSPSLPLSTLRLRKQPNTHTHHTTKTGCNEESEAEQLLAKAQRVFARFDPSEGGFIQAADLQQGAWVFLRGCGVAGCKHTYIPT